MLRPLFRSHRDERGQSYAAVAGVGLLLCIVAAAVLIGCSYHRVEAGAIGIKVDYGQVHNGKPDVQIIPTTGVVWIWPGQQVKLTDYRIQQHTLKMVQSGNEGQVKGDDSVACHDKNGIQVNVDSTSYWRVTGDNAESLYFLRPGQELDGDTVNDGISGQLVRPTVRNTLALTCSQYTYEEIFGSKRGEFYDAAKGSIAKALAATYVTLDNFQGGEIHLQQQFADAIAQKAQSQQAAERAAIDVTTAENNASAKKKTADGDAYSIGAVNVALVNAPGYIGYMNAQANLLQAQKFDKSWDGHLPQYLGAGSNVLLPASPQK